MTQTLIEKLQELQRYEVDYIERGGEIYPDTFPNKDGNCVRYSDLRAIIEQYKKEGADRKPDAWLIPHILDLTKSRKVHFFRTPEGRDKTDDELKENINGTVVYAAELFSDHDENEYVEDKHGVKHYYKPLYTLHSPTIVAELVKALEDVKQAVIVASDHYYDQNNMPIANKYNEMLSGIDALLAKVL